MKNKPNKGQRYFPNNCEAIRHTPDKYFPEMPIEAFMEWKIHGYQIPDSVFAIIRMKDKDGKYTEKYYNSERGARQCLQRGMSNDQEITMCTMDGMYFLKPEDYRSDFNQP